MKDIQYVRQGVEALASIDYSDQLTPIQRDVYHHVPQKAVKFPSQFLVLGSESAFTFFTVNVNLAKHERGCNDVGLATC